MILAGKEEKKKALYEASRDSMGQGGEVRAWGMKNKKKFVLQVSNLSVLN